METRPDWSPGDSVLPQRVAPALPPDYSDPAPQRIAIAERTVPRRRLYDPESCDRHRQETQQHPRAVRPTAIDHQDRNGGQQAHDTGHDPQADNTAAIKILITVHNEVSGKGCGERAEDHADQGRDNEALN